MGMFLTACMVISVRNLVDAGLSLLDVAFLRLSISVAVMILVLLMTRRIGHHRCAINAYGQRVLSLSSFDGIIMAWRGGHSDPVSQKIDSLIF